jgi:hypothetical protein
MVQKYQQLTYTQKYYFSPAKNELINKSYLLLLHTTLDNLLTQSLSHIQCGNWDLNQNTTFGDSFQSHLPWAWSDVTQLQDRKMSSKCAKCTVCSTTFSGFRDNFFLTDVLHVYEQNTINIQGLIYSWTLQQWWHVNHTMQYISHHYVTFK